MALQIDIKAVVEEGQEHLATRPCVDCGLVTGSYCDKCLAKDRMASEEWIPSQGTPLCMFCDSKWAGICHYCREQAWVQPPKHSWPRPDQVR